MKIAIIDAEIVDKNKHHFPNLACMKISSFYKSQGNEVILNTDYENFAEKGVTVDDTATTYQIMQKISEVSGGSSGAELNIS